MSFCGWKQHLLKPCYTRLCFLMKKIIAVAPWVASFISVKLRGRIACRRPKTPPASCNPTAPWGKICSSWEWGPVKRTLTCRPQEPTFDFLSEIGIMFIGNQMQTYVTAAFLDHQEQNAEIIGFQFGAELVLKPIRGVNLEKKYDTWPRPMVQDLPDAAWIFQRCLPSLHFLYLSLGSWIFQANILLV